MAEGDALARAGNDNERLTLTNSLVLDNGEVVPGGVPFDPDPLNPIRGFATDFNIVNASAELVWRAAPTLPLTLFADVAHNTGADTENTALWAGVGLGLARLTGL
jgi:hypothetical protein